MCHWSFKICSKNGSVFSLSVFGKGGWGLYCYIFYGNFFFCPIYIYIYIYMHCHPQTNCFVISQLISMARHARCFKPGSKLGWLYTSRISYRTAISNHRISEEILTHMYHFLLFTYTLNGYQMLNSLEKLCITRVATGNSFARVLKKAFFLHWTGDAHSVMAKVLGSRLGYPSSNLNEAVYISHRDNTFGKYMNPAILPPIYG